MSAFRSPHDRLMALVRRRARGRPIAAAGTAAALVWVAYVTVWTLIHWHDYTSGVLSWGGFLDQDVGVGGAGIVLCALLVWLAEDAFAPPENGRHGGIRLPRNPRGPRPGLTAASPAEDDSTD